MLQPVNKTSKFKNFFNSADFGAKTEADTCGQLYDAVYDGDFEKVKEILCWDDKSKEKVKL